jgi:hypothetical protein
MKYLKNTRYLLDRFATFMKCKTHFVKQLKLYFLKSAYKHLRVIIPRREILGK